METATVVIGSKSWNVQVATTFEELTQGLSNTASLEAGTGVLFDLGEPQQSISINMDEMNYPLDIIFIKDDLTVVAVDANVQPKQDFTETPISSEEARYFMEVNAGEASGVDIGENVVITGYTPPADNASFTNQLEFNGLIESMIGLMVIIMFMQMIMKQAKD